MLQHKLMVSSLFALVLVSVSWVMSTGAVRGSEKCLNAPNAQPPRDEHWYYWTDRGTNRQCWYLAPRDMTARKRTIEEPKLSRPQLPSRAPLSAPLTGGTTLDGAADASAAETNIPAPESAISMVERAKLPDRPSSLERETSESTDLIGLAPAAGSGPVDQLHIVTPAEVKADHPSPVVVVTLALMALFGLTYHIVRWLHRRKARNRWNTEWSNWSALNESFICTESSLDVDSRERITETLQQLLSELQAKLNERSDLVRPATDRELDRNRTPAVSAQIR